MRIAVLGLGYVGLPLAIELGKIYPTTGFDLKTDLIEQYRQGCGPPGEWARPSFESVISLSFTANSNDLRGHDVYIVAVPTPVDDAKQPDLRALRLASEMLGRVMTKGCLIVYESTVYPGATEEICIPILEQLSGLTWRQDFNVGYSPERINPGDTARTLTKIVKVVSADTPAALEKVIRIYSSIIDAGIHAAPSIKVAEAAKVIENTQRDLNIAFINELAIIFDRMDIDTRSVLDVAQTKWNFLGFAPGLVGGHCIGVDPYYLTAKAQSLGYLPEVILAGRRINDGMGKFIAEKTVKKMLARGRQLSNHPSVLVCGLTFKEDSADLRNSQVKQVIAELRAYHLDVLAHDPVVDESRARGHCDVDLMGWSDIPRVAAIILAVPHQRLRIKGVEEFCRKLLPGGVFIDVKSAFQKQDFQHTDVDYWRL